MKIKVIIALSLFSAGFAGSVSAHELRNQFLTATFGASATDVWQVECRNGGVLVGDSSRLVAQVQDGSANSNLISIQIFKDGKASNSTDPVGGNAAYSPSIFVNGGNGIYTMLVNQTKAGFQFYNITYHCENAAGSHTPTTVPTVPIQNQ